MVTMQPNPQKYTFADLDYFYKNKKEKRRILFCNIAYMKYYNVDIINDIPVNGGEYVRISKDATEKYNFHEEDDGCYYGFVETKYADSYTTAKQPKQIHIENIDREYKNNDKIDDVTVIFCAKSNILNKTVIVGWYKNATVFRNRKHYEVGRAYNICAKANDSYLIPELYRRFEIPRAKESDKSIGFGQSNVWYANTPECRKYVAKVIDYIDNYTQEIYLDASDKKEYSTIIEVLNQCFGNNYKGYMKAEWINKDAYTDFSVWFPQLAIHDGENYVPASHDCVNTISDDWEEFIFEDLKQTENSEYRPYQYSGKTLIFAKEPKGGSYIFRGVYVQDKEKSKPNYLVSKRVASRVLVIGAPANDIDLLDNIDIDIPESEEEQEKQARELSDEIVRKLAYKRATKEPKKKEVALQTQIIRDPYVSEEAKRRANGICQLCGQPAPFCKSDGKPYLETHHIVFLSRGGEDSPKNTAALCPNCHRKMHVLEDPKDVEKLLKSVEKYGLKEESEGAVGRKIQSKAYGVGTVVEINSEDDIIRIDFGGNIKNFKMKSSFERKLLVYI